LNGRVKYWYLLVAAMGLGACAAPDNRLTVKQFYVRDQEDDQNIDPMIRAEKNRIFHGAVSMEERRERLGQYYTVLWDDSEGAGSSHTVLFEFQQGGSGSLIKKRTVSFPAADSSGKAAFSVIGDDYFKGGKVLAWKISLLRDKEVISTKQSYLWQ
jgi:hypothetical protein